MNKIYNVFKFVVLLTVATAICACGRIDADQGNAKDTVAVQASGELRPFDVEAEFAANPFSCLRGAGMLVCAGTSDSSNAMTIGWGAFGTLWRVPAVTVYVAESRYTYGFMEHSDYFTVMAFDDPEVLEYMGTHSGRDGDKASTLNLTTLHTENFMSPVPSDFYSGGCKMHHMYIGQVVSAMKR